MPDPDSRPALKLLQTVYGYKTFRGDQEAIIEHVVGGGDAFVLMPTGSGKSLCYQIPSLIRNGPGIVISPLIALMHDQVTALRQLGIKAACLNSSLSMDEARRTEGAYVRGEIDLLYAAPERLVTPRFLELLDQVRPGLFAIDVDRRRFTSGAIRSSPQRRRKKSVRSLRGENARGLQGKAPRSPSSATRPTRCCGTRCGKLAGSWPSSRESRPM